MIDGLCTNRHRLSQALLEEYLLNNLEQEYEHFKIRNIEIEKKITKKKKQRTAKQINSEMERLNLMFQKDRISFEYYDGEYTKLRKELDDLSIVEVSPNVNYSYLESVLQSDVNQIYNALSPENRQAFWHRIIKEIHLTADSKVDYIIFL